MICPYIDKEKTQQNTKTLIEDLRSVIKSGFYEVKKLNIAEVEKICDLTTLVETRVANRANEIIMKLLLSASRILSQSEKRFFYYYFLNGMCIKNLRNGVVFCDECIVIANGYYILQNIIRKLMYSFNETVVYKIKRGRGDIMSGLEFNLKQYDKSNSEDLMREFDKRKKVEPIAIEDIKYNPLNPDFDTLEDIVEFADKIYHNPNGVLEVITVYRDSDGKYMLVSGHKRIKACKYNIEHESELDGTGKVQKTIVATIVKKPDNEIEEMNTILTYNDYRRFDTEEKKYTLFKAYYQYVAVLNKNGEFKGRIREFISKQSGLGLKKVGDFIDELENTVLMYLNEFKDDVNRNLVNIEERNDYLIHKSGLPIETLQLVLTKIKKKIEEDSKVKNDDEVLTGQTSIDDFVKDDLSIHYEEVRMKLTNYFDAKCMVTKNNKITINCVDIKDLNRVLQMMGVITND